MKKIFLLTCLAMVAFSLCAQPIKAHGKLEVKGTKLVDEHGNAVVLRGMSFGWHNYWPRFYNKEAVHWLAKDWGATVVRAAMGVEPKNGYIDDRETSTRLIRNVVDAAIAEGIYAIIDWHSHNINLSEAKTFFHEMATLYGDKPNVIYEIFNEPDKESWADVKKYSEEVIQTIRAVDRDNIILVGSPHWDQDIHLVADDPLQGFSNIMYTLHFYAATHGQFLRDRADYALKKNIPIFISESAGMEATGNGPINDAEWQRWLDWAEKNRISWITWSISDKDETCSVLQKSAGSNGGWTDADLKESGLKTKALIRKYQHDQ